MSIEKHLVGAVYIDSRFGVSIDATNDFEVFMGQEFTCGVNEEFQIVPVQASIPTTFYNINAYNNKLIYTMSGISYTATITVNNYNTSTLLTALLSALNTGNSGWTNAYDSQALKYTIKHATTYTVIAASSTCFEVIGFTSTNTTPTGQGAGGTTPFWLSSNCTIDLTYTRNFQIKLYNVTMRGLDSSTGGISTNIVAQIPISRNSPGITFWENSAPEAHISVLPKIIPRTIRVQLLDDDRNVTDIRNGHWSFMYHLYIVPLKGATDVGILDRNMYDTL